MFEPENLKKFNTKLRALAKALKKTDADIDKDVIDVLNKGANNIRSRIILSMRNTKRAAHFYIRGKKKHHPSAEYNPPAIDGGDLIDSILFNVTKRKMSVGSTILNPAYPLFLEEGTRKMRPRPWLEPAFDAEEATIVNDLGEVIPDKISKIFGGV